MNSEMFEKIVKARADERVDAKIQAFKSACWSAGRQLLGAAYHGYDTPELMQCFAILASGTHGKGWPEKLWGRGGASVKEELLGTLDAMQKAFLAAETAKPAENSPAVEGEVPA